MTIEIHDYNNDGYLDTLRSYYDGGSSCGGNYIKIKNGKTNDLYELDTYGCFNQIKNILLIPHQLLKSENRSFLEAIKNKILPEEFVEPDASLDWIIKGSLSNKILANHEFYDKIIDPKIKWDTGLNQMPSMYYLSISGDTLNSLLYKSVDDKDEINDSNKALLIYYGHNHYRNPTKDSLTLVAGNKTYKIYRTSHGVIASKGKLSKWVFISDSDLTDAPEKLRWESVSEVKLYRKHIIVKQKLPPFDLFNLYIINIETGICGCIKYTFDEESNDGNEESAGYLINGKSFFLILKGKKIRYKLKEIFTELEDYSINK